MARSTRESNWLHYIDLRSTGITRQEASRQAGVSYAAASAFDQGNPSSSGYNLYLAHCAGREPWTITAVFGRTEEQERDQLIQRNRLLGLSGPKDADAQLALDDFATFRRRYFGRTSVGYQNELGNLLFDKWRHGRATLERQFILVNIAPGAGKTSTVRDFLLRCIVEDRRLRAAHFSVTTKLSVPLTRSAKVELERTQPYRANPEDIARKTGFDAFATLAQDFGLFKPHGQGNVWTKEAFIVVQPDGASGDKEPTVGSWGKDGSFIGNRINLAICDDFIDAKSTRTDKALRDTEEIWDNEVETRLEPGGLLLLIGQRLHVEDIYRYAREKLAVDIDSTDDVETIDLETQPRKYTHFTYPAHFEDRCKGHGPDDPKPVGYPEGCLLEPVRLPWRTLLGAKLGSKSRFGLVYQQDDTVSDDSLIQRLWVDGGMDKTQMYPGCWDVARGLWQMPEDAVDPVGVITLDPSPTQHWGCLAWAYAPDGSNDRRPGEAPGRRILLDVRNERMDAPDILDLNLAQRVYHGLLEEWYRAYQQIGVPLQYVIVEVNAAQRFLFQYDFARSWSQTRGVTFITHTTTTMKLDPKLGLGVLKNPYMAGRYRLPGLDPATRRAVDPLVRQLTTQTAKDDVLMSNWFLEVKLPAIALRSAPRRGPAQVSRPSWLRGASANRRRDPFPTGPATR